MNAPMIQIDRLNLHIYPRQNAGMGMILGAILKAAAPAQVRSNDEVPTARFELSSDGTVVTDHKTGLQWAAEESPKKLDFADAERHCGELRLGGFEDWRLPDLEELESIRDLSRHAPCIDTAFFKSNADWTWSRTPCAWSSGSAWIVSFYYGNVYSYNRYYRAFARAVRRVSPAGQ